MRRKVRKLPIGSVDKSYPISAVLKFVKEQPDPVAGSVEHLVTTNFQTSDATRRKKHRRADPAGFSVRLLGKRGDNLCPAIKPGQDLLHPGRGQGHDHPDHARILVALQPVQIRLGAPYRDRQTRRIAA